MPRVKIDYVVSFSSEDPEHPASNLLAWEVSKKKWLCKKGESSCSVVLQLTKAVKISSIHIGAYHSALVEVLVARSENGNEQYEVLVPSSVFVPPGESRRDAGVERVRSFCGEQLAGGERGAGGARAQRWDRVRLVCSQPYNKHCKYGLSFVHVEESGEAAESGGAVPAVGGAFSAVGGAVPGRLLALNTYSSDEDEFRPGELFAKHRLSNTPTDTGAQIRQATSQALKNIPEASTKLIKTPISKPSGQRRAPTASSQDSSDDHRPHDRIDNVVRRHHSQKKTDPELESKEDKEKHKNDKHKKNQSTPKRRESDNPTAKDASPSKRLKRSDETSSGMGTRVDNAAKVPHGEQTERVDLQADGRLEEGAPAEPRALLRGVVLVLSGYQNPARARVRDAALALGARVERAWGPHCTHLVCAFPNTPKLRAARAAGGEVPAATADWVLQCAARRRRLPWEWFATEPHRRRPEPPRARTPPPRARTPPPRARTPPPRARTPPPDTDGDTDDEIRRVIEDRNRRPVATEEREGARSEDGEVRDDPAADEYERSTDEEGAAGGDEGGGAEGSRPARFGGALPDFFEGHTFAVEAPVPAADRLARYIRAYGGLVLQMSDPEVEYRVAGDGGVAWLERCRRHGKLLPPD